MVNTRERPVFDPEQVQKIEHHMIQVKLKGLGDSTSEWIPPTKHTELV